MPYFGYFATCEHCRTFVASPYRLRSKNMVGSVLVKQSDLRARLRKIGTEESIARKLRMSKGFSCIPKDCDACALKGRCDMLKS